MFQISQNERRGFGVSGPGRFSDLDSMLVSVLIGEIRVRLVVRPAAVAEAADDSLDF